MARPKLPQSAKARPVKIYMRNTIRKAGAELAFKRNLSLSQLVCECLRRELQRAERAA